MADLSIVYEYSPNTWMYTFKNIPLQSYQYAGIAFKTSRGMYTFGVVCDAGLSISNFQCDEYLNGNFRQTRYCALMTTTYGGVTYNIYTASQTSYSPIPFTSGIALDCEELSVDTQELNAAIGAYFAQFVNYRYYLDVNGNEEYFEWRGCTAGGWVFDIIQAIPGNPSDHYHCAVLAYDLRQISNPSITSMYYSYWGQNINTVYIREHYDVYLVFTNLSVHDSGNPRGYDVQLEAVAQDSYSMAAAIRAYWDGLGGVENIYVGVNGKAQQVKKMYVGVNGLAREVKAIYVGVNGLARKVFPIEEDSTLWIFRNGSFTDAVMTGFDISQYKSSFTNPVVDMSTFSQWFLSQYALAQGARNGEPFYIENGYLRKSGTHGDGLSTTGKPIGATNVNFFVPIKRATGFTKIVFEAITIQNNGVDHAGADDYNLLAVKAGRVNNGTFVTSQTSMWVASQDTWKEYEYSITDLPYVDYINLFGCDGSPAYRNIRLVKD